MALVLLKENKNEPKNNRSVKEKSIWYTIQGKHTVMFWAKLIKHTYPISASHYQKIWEIFLEVMLIDRGESLLKNSQNNFLNSEQNF